MNRIVIITGVSGSGKSTLQQELLNRGWKRPLNFTTRKPRSKDVDDIDEEGDFISKERDEYIFLNEKTFFTKLSNGDFLENTNSYGNNYGVSAFLPKGDNVIVLDPVGREQVMEFFTRGNIPFETYYLGINKLTQLDRLKKRGDTEKGIIARQKDFERFHPTHRCVELDGTQPVEVLADIIENNGK